MGDVDITKVTDRLTEFELMALERIQKILEYTFKDKRLLLEAITHRSYINDLKKLGRPVYTYERLEFLGDAVLALVVSEILFKKYNHFDEGILSKVRSWVVDRQTLSQIVKKKRINKYIVLGESEEATGGRDKPYILAAVFEAIVGALFLELGYDGVYFRLEGLFDPLIKDRITNETFVDPKTMLQELTQRYWKVLPDYEVISIDGKEHERKYTVCVKIKGKIYATGIGKSKKEAEFNAASKAIRLLRKQKDIK